MHTPAGAKSESRGLQQDATVNIDSQSAQLIGLSIKAEDKATTAESI